MSINSEMTALADAIRNKSGVTGKLSIADMTTAVGNIVINPGGGDIDFTGVTVTADKMLAGIVAVGADGNKVTGNIQTVAASSDGEFVTIPAGFHPTEQRFPITISGDGGYDTSSVTATADTMLYGTTAIGKSGETITGNIQTVTPSVNKNTFTVAKGYVAEAFTETIAESTVTETDSSVTITPGYVAETLNFEIGGGSADGGDSDVVFGYLDENKMFQALDLSGDEPVKIGEPEEIDKFTTFNIPEISFPLRLSLKNSTGSASVHMVLARGSNDYYNYLDNSIYYRTQDNRNWRLLEVDATNIKKSETISLSANNTYVEFWGKSSTLSVHFNYYYNFIMSGDDIEASGGVMSLINNNELYKSCFNRLFESCTNLVSAPELPATQLAENCYMSMFENCTNLVSAPELPATQLADGCYSNMFAGCTNLVSAPELPATQLAKYCYSWMFADCTNLVSAPELPATQLVDDCYLGMFADCTKLKSIRVHFSSWDTDNESTSYWVRDVATIGNFYKPSNLATEYGIHHIPENWVVHDID